MVSACPYLKARLKFWHHDFCPWQCVREESLAIDCDDVDEFKEEVPNSMVDMADPLEVLEVDQVCGAQTSQEEKMHQTRSSQEIYLLGEI